MILVHFSNKNTGKRDKKKTDGSNLFYIIYKFIHKRRKMMATIPKWTYLHLNTQCTYNTLNPLNIMIVKLRRKL